MFRKVSNSDICYMASFHHVMISAKIISLKLWPKVKFLCHLKLLEDFIFLNLCVLSTIVSSPSSAAEGFSWKSYPSELLELSQLPNTLVSPSSKRLIFRF